MLINAEKRALEEFRSLSERVHHLQGGLTKFLLVYCYKFLVTTKLLPFMFMQASLDTVQSAEQAQEVVNINEFIYTFDSRIPFCSNVAFILTTGGKSFREEKTRRTYKTNSSVLTLVLKFWSIICGQFGIASLQNTLHKKGCKVCL